MKWVNKSVIFTVIGIIAIGALLSKCVIETERMKDQWTADKAAKLKRLKSECILIAKEKPGSKSGRYDVYRCGAVEEWYRLDWKEIQD